MAAARSVYLEPDFEPADLAAVLLASVVLLAAGTYNPFIYFRF